MRSLRARLLALLGGTVLVAWLATAIFSYFDLRHELGEMLDAHLAQSARLLLGQVEHGLGDLETRVRPHRHDEEPVYQVWDAAGRLRLRSDSAPEQRLSNHERGFADVNFDGERWRVVALWDPEHRLQVLMAQQYELRGDMAEDVAQHLMHPLGIALPVIGLLIWFSVGWGLRPLKTMARQVGERAPDNLAPLDARDAPREVLPLATALNALFQRLAVSLEKERRFTADAAHELRTPLAAVKTQAQVARAARDEAARMHALDKVVAGVDRSAHLVEQLLVLARLDPGASAARRAPVDLARLAAACVGEQAGAATAKDIDIGVEGEGEAVVAGDEGLLGILLRNLLDNAIRYTPAGGRVTVRVARRGREAALVVSDTGPGIPSAEREQVLRRFYRVLGSGEEGSGLGLSIVERIADLHGARLTLRDAEDGCGLAVEVAFPLHVAQPRRSPANVG